jgi:hypothetical protein
MSVGDRQHEILMLIERALNVEVREKPQFSWLRNRHEEREFGVHFHAISTIFRTLGGDEEKLRSKGSLPLTPDGYLGGAYNCLVEFDEVQHFSTARAQTLVLLPDNLPLGFSRADYLELCRVHAPTADGYRRAKRTPEFDFAGGRTAQRAYFDCFRDLLPALHGLRPTIRISEFEVQAIKMGDPGSVAALADIVNKKVPYGP